MIFAGDPCRQCSAGLHVDCIGYARWCGCSHPDCLERKSEHDTNQGESDDDNR